MFNITFGLFVTTEDLWIFGFVVYNKTAMQKHHQLQISVQITVHLK